ncbi:MAG: prenyltransferase/squalene oxidase repeat-containing protein [Cyclobacteriaceae bacterium]
MIHLNRREFVTRTALLAGGMSLGLYSCAGKNYDILKGIQDFIHGVANPDGSFRPGIDPAYKGNSDTGLSGLASPAYATILCATFGWPLPYPDKTLEFFQSCQKPDGAFYPTTGSMDQTGPLAKLYNTVQATVSLRIMGAKPRFDTTPVIEHFFKDSEFKELPLYTTSFFPLYYCAAGEKMPPYIDSKMREYIIREQKDDGYLQDHVAATFHAAHYFRMVGEPTPKADVMVERVLRDQKQDGSWHLREPDWDVHACFDALYILKQVGDQRDSHIQEAYKKATEWILQCRKPDGGFAHFPEETNSDMDAVYFQAGALVQSGFVETQRNLKNEEILGWGHAMDPEKKYSCI